METERVNKIRLALMEEIVQIHYQAAVLGAPRTREDRSLLARYGKLLYHCQRLLNLVPDEENAVNKPRTPARYPREGFRSATSGSNPAA